MKTRVLAAALVEAGHVRLNRVKVLKPGHAVGPGDVLTIALNARVRVLKVAACAARRGSAAEAQRLYSEAAMPFADGAMPQKEDASGAGTC